MADGAADLAGAAARISSPPPLGEGDRGAVEGEAGARSPFTFPPPGSAGLPPRGGRENEERAHATEVVTFGCRLNAHESEVMAAQAARDGVRDTVVFNTCAVTAEAVRQARQAIRKMRRERPDARLVVTGCAAQIDPTAFAAMDGVAFIVPNAVKTHSGALAGATPSPLSRNHNPHTSTAPTSPNCVIPDAAPLGRGDPGPRRPGQRTDRSSLSPAPPSVEWGHLGPGQVAPSARLSGMTQVEGGSRNQNLAATTPRPPTPAPTRRARAYVEIQNGCDHRCTFCVIPFGRGPSRSIAAETVAAQVRALAEAGCAEVVLTGVDLTSWGADLAGAPKLGDLVRTVLAAAPRLPRLRLSSLDAAEMDTELMAVIAGEARLMPHLHLSLQSGDDLILKRMKRRHSRQAALDLIGAVRAARPEAAFGADFIAGFPTESEAAFDNTVRFIGEADLAFLHVFPFSPRPGTPAARMPRLAQKTVKARAARLRAAGDAALGRHLASLVGSGRRAVR